MCSPNPTRTSSTASSSRRPRRHRESFVDAPKVERIHERGVVLVLDAADARRLPEPGENPATLSAHPGDTAEGELERKLRRAWDLISGRY